MIKVLIADDHQIVIDGLRSILDMEETVEVVAEASDGMEVLDKLKNETVDIVILDINMPVMDGIETAIKIRELYPNLKVLILTMYNNAEFIKRLNLAGADGFILKNTGREELMSALMAINGGKTYYGQEVTKTLLDSENTSDRSGKVQLTKREKEVLKLLADGMTTLEISQRLFISTHTVESHRKNLLSKYQTKNTAGLVKYAFQNGLLST